MTDEIVIKQSFIIGAAYDATGSAPLCASHQIDNLLDRRYVGGVVDGPNAASFDDEFFEEARECPAGWTDAFSAFDRDGWHYWDDVRSWPTDEPALDYTAVSMLVFAQQFSNVSLAESSVVTPVLSVATVPHDSGR
eukprot:TRINITY_DN2657_c0_g1_i1.p1 TRINITY_DN2657_c0_g1~~TRINITY_DN2657_c0_g1_i1.p1  ORF type:complete len:136 (-),score=29.22 TRINITY_DN2657_c0_g1_i1:113-520(-)